MRRATQPASAADESPVFIPSAGETLFAVLTRPTGEPSGLAVILLTGGSYIPSINRNRLWVRLARSLAASGHHVLRLDYHGVGESTGLVEHFELREPFTDDLESAARWVRTLGVSDVVVVGVCFGAVTALASAERLHGLRGVALFAHPVRDYELLEDLGTVGYVRHILGEEGVRGVVHRGKRLLSYASLAAERLRATAGRLRRREQPDDDPTSDQLLDGLASASRLGIATLIAYGTEEGEGAEFEAARSGRLGRILSDAGDLIQVHTLTGNVHDLIGLSVQDDICELTESWLSRLTSRAGAAPAAATGAG